LSEKRYLVQDQLKAWSVISITVQLQTFLGWGSDLWSFTEEIHLCTFSIPSEFI